MPNKISTFGESLSDEARTLGDKVADAAGQVKDKMSDFGATTAETIDGNRDMAANRMDKAAAALHQTAENLPGEKVSGLAHGTAEKLSSTADYVRRHNVDAMMADVERLVKNNPGPSLIAAAVIGFLVGRAFTRTD